MLKTFSGVRTYFRRCSVRLFLLILRCLWLFVCSGTQCGVVFIFCIVCILCCQFLWIVHLLLPLWYSREHIIVLIELYLTVDIMKQARPWMLANLKIICQFHAHPVHQNRGEIFCAKIYWGGYSLYFIYSRISF
jgi:hypothetical protein